MLNESFCQYLEFEITKTLSNSSNPEINNFWCDGILLPSNENHYAQKIINDKKQLEVTAFMGIDGQDTYKMTLYFGNKSLSKYARNLDLKACIPSENEGDWLFINVAKKEINIQLK